MKPLLFLMLAAVASPLAARAQNGESIPLWPNGVPGFEDRKNEPEQAASYWVKHIHNPSITVFLPPKEKASGAAVLICPGGGHRELGFEPLFTAVRHYIYARLVPTEPLQVCSGV